MTTPTVMRRAMARYVRADGDGDGNNGNVCDNDDGIEPALRVPTLVRDEVTMLEGSVVPVSNDAGIAPTVKVPTPVMPV